MKIFAVSYRFSTPLGSLTGMQEFFAVSKEAAAENFYATHKDDYDDLEVESVNDYYCGRALTDEDILKMYAGYCSRHLKGRTSEKKRASSAENGKKGGRPRKNWFVANNDGDIIGHDMTKAKAEALAEEMKSKEPDAEWEAMSE